MSRKLIYANAATQLLRGKCVAKYPSTFMMGLFAAADEIAQLPVVDAVEVVHGHWTEKIICGGFAEEWGYKCSICGCTVSERSGLGVYQGRNQQLNYCPNCGAKMDENGE